MSKAKHTKGPWITWDTGHGMGVVPEDVVNGALIPNVSAFRYEICRLKLADDTPNWDTQWEFVKANAHLIAAAPDLLFATENLLETLRNLSVQITAADAALLMPAMDVAKEAIKKARGE